MAEARWAQDPWQSTSVPCAAPMVPVRLHTSKHIAAPESWKFLETALICPFQQAQGTGTVKSATVLWPKPVIKKNPTSFSPRGWCRCPTVSIYHEEILLYQFPVSINRDHGHKSKSMQEVTTQFYLLHSAELLRAIYILNSSSKMKERYGTRQSSKIEKMRAFLCDRKPRTAWFYLLQGKGLLILYCQARE